MNLEPDTIYTRYFRYKNQLTDDELKWATELDFENDVALVVTILEGDREIVIGGARYSVLKSDLDTPKRAEIAFTVEEDYQGQGIASRLLKHMACIAREKGVSFFEAEVLSQNKPMIVVFERGGFAHAAKIRGRRHLSVDVSRQNVTSIPTASGLFLARAQVRISFPPRSAKDG